MALWNSGGFFQAALSVPATPPCRAATAAKAHPQAATAVPHVCRAADDAPAGSPSWPLTRVQPAVCAYLCCVEILQGPNERGVPVEAVSAAGDFGAHLRQEMRVVRRRTAMRTYSSLSAATVREMPIIRSMAKA